MIHELLHIAEFGTCYTITETSEKLKCSRRQVRNFIDDGDLAAFDVSRQGSKHRDLRVSEEALDAFEASRKIPPKYVPTASRSTKRSTASIESSCPTDEALTFLARRAARKPMASA